jgi:hypothetical protein
MWEPDMKPDIMKVVLPLFSEDTPIREVFDRATQMSSPAVVARDGDHFNLLFSHDLEKQALKSPAVTLGNMRSAPAKFIELSGSPDRVVAFSLTDIAKLPVGKRIAMAAIASDFEGNQMAIVYGYAADLYNRVVSKVYVCPRDNEEYNAPGMCPKHWVALTPKKKK